MLDKGRKSSNHIFVLGFETAAGLSVHPCRGLDFLWPGCHAHTACCPGMPGCVWPAHLGSVRTSVALS